MNMYRVVRNSNGTALSLIQNIELLNLERYRVFRSTQNLGVNSNKNEITLKDS